jgi:formylglycine-generating enzyme required for sulfatase activity
MTGKVEKQPQVDQNHVEQSRNVYIEQNGNKTSALESPPARPKRKFPILIAAFGALVLLFACGACWFISANVKLFAVAKTPTQQAFTLFTATDIPATEMIRTTFLPTETPVPFEASIPVEIEDEKNIPMRLVPSGEFTMGNDTGDIESRPASLIYVETFYIDKYEVTNEMYSVCVFSGTCRLPRQSGSATRSSYFNNPVYATYPVIYLDWKMAKTYCEWRGARLPTEAEWEKAARGADDMRAYPWGNNFDCDFANHSGCIGDTAPVSQYDQGKSPYGVYGMSGNVWEWTNSLYSFYPYSSTDGREDPDASGNRMARGGSWHIFGGPGGNIRVDTRFKLDPTYYGAYVGVRCALTK